MEYTSSSGIAMPAHYALIPQEEMSYLDGGAITQQQIVQFGVNVLVNGLMLVSSVFFSSGVSMIYNAYHGTTITTGNRVMKDFFSSLTGPQWAFLTVGTVMGGYYAYGLAVNYYNALVKPLIGAFQEAYEQTVAEEQAQAQLAAA